MRKGGKTGNLRRTAPYVDRILKGEKPGDLPVQASTKYYLTINLSIAEALGLKISPDLLAAADEVLGVVTGGCVACNDHRACIEKVIERSEQPPLLNGPSPQIEASELKSRWRVSDQEIGAASPRRWSAASTLPVPIPQHPSDEFGAPSDQVGGRYFHSQLWRIEIPSVVLS